MKLNKLLASLAAVGATAGGLQATVIEVSNAITTPTTWTSANEYVLTDVIFVKDGATLTIEAGTVVRGEPISSGNFDPGALVVTRTGQIEANGSASSPIIFTTAALETSAGSGVVDTSIDYDDSNGVNDYTTASLFLDADPVGSPLDPGLGFSTTAADTTHLNEEYRGLWGGVVILGSAPTSIGDIDTVNDKLVASTKNANAVLDDYFEGVVEGLDPAVVGEDGVYGGSNPNDSSGTFRFVSIRHGGATLAADNELNGLTMGGVGHGTLIENVEVYNNDDDGFEWFGGTVNTRFLASIYNNDDSFDMDEGFQGLGQFWFSLGIDDGVNSERGGEHDGTDAIFSSVDVDSINGVSMGTGDAGGGLPLSYCTVYNATWIGAGNVIGGKDSNDCFRIRDSWGGAYFNSVFADFDGQWITVEADGQDRVATGDVVFRSNLVYNMDGNTGATAIDSGSTSDDNFQTATDPYNVANNNVFPTTNPFQMATIVRRADVDPRVTTTANGSVTLEPTTATYFIPAGYVGAFSPVEDAFWTDGWTLFDQKFALAPASR